MTDTEARNINVKYRNAEPYKIQLLGWHRDGEYKRKTDYTFKLDGSTAVLTHIKPNDGSYQVQLADEERAVVKETVADLPFVQGVVMFE